MPISLTVFAKNTKASEEAKIERKRNEDTMSEVRLTDFIASFSKIRKSGINIIAPRMFCQATIVTGEYLLVSCFRKTENIRDEITAPKSARIPRPSPEKDKVLEASMIATPEKEIKIPKILSLDIFSLNVSQATIGEKTGIVAIMTLEIVAEVYLTPKFSPRK